MTQPSATDPAATTAAYEAGKLERKKGTLPENAPLAQYLIKQGYNPDKAGVPGHPARTIVLAYDRGIRGHPMI